MELYNLRMATEKLAPTGEQGNRLLRFYKKFNKISAAVFASAGIIFDSGVLLGLAAFDVAQAWGVSKLEKWNQRRKADKTLGGLAIKGA